MKKMKKNGLSNQFQTVLYVNPWVLISQVHITFTFRLAFSSLLLKVGLIGDLMAINGSIVVDFL